MFCRFPDISPNEQVLPVLNDPDFEIETELPPLSRFISKDILRKMKPWEKKWQDVVNGKCPDVLFRHCGWCTRGTVSHL